MFSAEPVEIVSLSFRDVKIKCTLNTICYLNVVCMCLQWSWSCKIIISCHVCWCGQGCQSPTADTVRQITWLLP